MKPRTAHTPWRARSWLVLALALGTASLASVVWARAEAPAPRRVAGAMRAHELVHATTTPELSRRYGLAVVAVARPPDFATSAAARGASSVEGAATAGCPVRVTAIVEAEEPSESFAILVGVDGTSALVRRGERMGTPRGVARVEAIESSGVRLGFGAEGVHCAFFRTGQ